jgi:uroporphyrinogen-III synthase
VADRNYWKRNNMSNRRYHILSTATLPFDRIQHIPETIEVSVVPFIKIIPRPGVELKPIISEFASEKRVIIFTSVHAVKYVGESLKTKPSWKIYCIRNETRSAVENYFGSESIAGYADNASSLSQLMINDKIREAIFFCGDQRMKILPEKLKNQGIELNEFIVYDTLQTPVKIKDQPDAVLFFSPSAAQSFFSVNDLDPETNVFAMGKTTAAVLDNLTSNKIIISPETDKAFVFNMAVEYAASHPIL